MKIMVGAGGRMNGQREAVGELLPWPGKNKLKIPKELSITSLLLTQAI